jgi:DNA (cytosine-5)-methyltransferase 1
MRIAGLFAGIGGIEHGLAQAGADFSTVLLCEKWEPAVQVLRSHFETEVHEDVCALASLPADVDVVTAGFPCTDLSQAGRMAGIRGTQSGLVGEVFRLLAASHSSGRPIPWLVIENVSNMLMLDKGEAMRLIVSELESLGYRWAYRVVDSRFTGVPQRRRRVILVASTVADPRSVLFADDAGPRSGADYREDAFGFYWTEGRGGLGWAVDAVPTLKGGSTVGIPSAPAIWVADAAVERSLVMPSIEDAEQLQGFPRGWTASGAPAGRRNGPRWKLVGNAVTVGVSKWLGSRLANPGTAWSESRPASEMTRWPLSAWGDGGEVHAVDCSEFPVHEPYQHLLDVVDVASARPLTYRGASGFFSRLSEGNLGRYPGFRESVAAFVEATDPVGGYVAV